MSDRALTPLRALAVVTAALLLAPGSVAAQARVAGEKPTATPATRPWAPPRTQDGQPDLQGTWLNNSATPLERPKALEGKPFLSDEELAEMKKRVARLFDVNGKSDFAGGDDVFLAALANPDEFRNPNGTGSPVTMAEESSKAERR